MINETKQTTLEWYSEITSKIKHTAVEYYAIEICELMRNKYGEGIIDLDVLNKAKEMEKEQAQAYTAFCVACDRKKLPLLEFEGWITLQGGNK